MILSVIACGPSALECGEIKGIRIGVNDAYRHVECDRVISMDGRWASHRAADFLGETSPPLYLRRSAYGHVQHFPPQHFRIYDCDINTHTFGEDEHTLNGNHSGYCALNLAYVMAHKFPIETVYLYGFDMREPTHFFGQYEWHGEGSSNSTGKFRKWADELAHAAIQFDKVGVKVFNTNKESAVKCFPFGRPK